MIFCLQIQHLFIILHLLCLFVFVISRLIDWTVQAPLTCNLQAPSVINLILIRQLLSSSDSGIEIQTLPFCYQNRLLSCWRLTWGLSVLPFHILMINGVLWSSVVPLCLTPWEKDQQQMTEKGGFYWKIKADGWGLKWVLCYQQTQMWFVSSLLKHCKLTVKGRMTQKRRLLRASHHHTYKGCCGPASMVARNSSNIIKTGVSIACIDRRGQEIWVDTVY